jgi:MoaA/NifB/PqqE/SkfB family radical SAM enzyme
MRKIDIKVHFYCNNFCRFCIQGDRRYLTYQKSTEEIREILKRGRKEGAMGVVFTGGEPTLRFKELLNWVQFAKDLGYQSIQIQTNGRMFSYLGFCQKIIEAGANEFGISLHASYSQLHDYLTRSPGSFNQTVQAIKNLVSLGQTVLTNTVITKYNYKDLPNTAKLLVSLRVTQYQLAFIHISQKVLNDRRLLKSLVPRFFEVMPYVKKALDIGIKRQVKCVTEAIPYCLMKGYEEHIAEKTAPDSHVFDAGYEIEHFSIHRKTKAKLKGPNCKFCKYGDVCEGTWKEYPQIFGWTEFKPILRNKS